MPAPVEPPHLLHRRFAPLRLVAATLRASTVPADAFFDPDDFMLVSWCIDDRPPGVNVFRHVDTRGVIGLDADGVPFLRRPVGGWAQCTTVREAVDALGLWELPWLRPDLAAHRQGRTWDARWELHAELTGAGLDRAS